MEAFFNSMLDFCVKLGRKLLIALLVLIVGSILIKMIKKSIRKKKISKYEDATVHRFLVNFIGIGLNVLLFVTIIAILGVPMASLVAVITSAGVAIGLALQGSLSNLAGGIMIVIFHPFKLDDYIETSDASGTVVDIGIFYTTLKTPDNKSITIPNGTLMNDKVTNYSVHNTRRLDFTLSVALGSDVNRVKTILLEEAAKHELVQKDPAPFCRLSKQTASSLDFSLRVWTLKDDYWTVNFDLLEAFNRRLKDEGFDIPHQQVDVTVKNK